MTAFVANPISVSKTNIRDNSIIPNALETADRATITPLWARCSFSISAGDRYTNRRLTKGTLKEAMQYAIAYRVPHQIKINIGIQALHFRPGLSYLEWGTDIADSPAGFVASTPAPAPAATGLPTDAPVPASAPAPSPINIATAVAHAVSAAIASAPAPAITVTPPAAPSTTKLRMLFNPSSLPANVRARYQDKLDRKILGPSIFNPFNCLGDPCHGLRHWLDPAVEKTVLADGTVFFHITIDEKMYMKNPVPCQKDTHASIRRWYNTFQETSMQYGIFVLPLWLF